MELEFDIDPTYEESKVSKGRLILKYNLNLFSLDAALGADFKVNVKDIEKKVNKFLNAYDRQYIKIDNITTKNVIFEFDVEKWLKDSINKKLENCYNKYEKNLKMNKLPSIVMANVNSFITQSLIEVKFKELLRKNRSLQKKITSSIKSLLVKEPTISFFDVKYDNYKNAMSISLKDVFQTTLLPEIAKINPYRKERNFDKNVMDLLKMKKS